MNGFRYRLSQYMLGRRGLDEYSKFLLIVSAVLFVISYFLLGRQIYRLFYIGAWLLLIYAYARIMSRNLQKRQMENLKFLQKKGKILGKAKFSSKKQFGAEEGAFYKYFKCPECGQNCRVPKNKGMIRITCPKCGTSFERRS